jgi:hypothetical protein
MSSPGRIFALLLGVAVTLSAGCGQGADTVERRTYVPEVVYAEPSESSDPALVFPRDLAVVGGRVYVLDGQMARVAIIDPERGLVTGTFGGPGEGPGELGLFPYALVREDDRIGVAHLYSVSWFTLKGDFLKRDQVPPLDMSTPSLQRTGDGWLYNAGYQGPDSAPAVYATGRGDTTRFGTAIEAPAEDRFGLAATELNAVHAVRFANGNVLLGWVHENRIETYNPSGELLSGDRWEHFPDEVERRPDGRLRSLPAFTFSASLGDNDTAYLVDGTMGVIGVYDADGAHQGTYELEGRAAKVVWTAAGAAFAIDGSDRLLRLRQVGVREEGAADPPGFPEMPDLPAPIPDWLGYDLGSGLGKIVRLNGRPARLATGGLRLWLVIEDRECFSCLDELPLVSALSDSLAPVGLAAAILALGDRHEAKRTLTGFDFDLPVFVSPNGGLPVGLEAYGTPLRLLTWHGRIVGITARGLDTDGGRRELQGLLDRWLGGTPLDE